jgi:hypothetical protein
MHLATQSEVVGGMVSADQQAEDRGVALGKKVLPLQE